MKIIGHRGARGLAPENTIASLRKALDCGVDVLEFDLRVTKDGVVILHHDPFLTDPNGEKQFIKNHTYSVLLAHKKDLVTFEQVLQVIGYPVPLYVEVKPDEPTKQIVQTIKSKLAEGWKSEYFMLASFSQRTLLELNKALPDIETVVIEKWSSVHAVYRARQLGTKKLCMNQRWLWRGFIAPMARRGWQLSAYPLNDKQKAMRWASYGLYGCVTDYPDRFQKP